MTFLSQLKVVFVATPCYSKVGAAARILLLFSQRTDDFGDAGKRHEFLQVGHNHWCPLAMSPVEVAEAGRTAKDHNLRLAQPF
jgi:hypothetical protein